MGSCELAHLPLVWHVLCAPAKQNKGVGISWQKSYQNHACFPVSTPVNDCKRCGKFKRLLYQSKTQRYKTRKKKEKIITLNHIFIHYILKQLINHQIWWLFHLFVLSVAIHWLMLPLNYHRHQQKEKLVIFPEKRKNWLIWSFTST